LTESAITPDEAAFVDQFQVRLIAFLQEALGTVSGNAEQGAVLIMLWHAAATAIISGDVEAEFWDEMCARAYSDARRVIEEYREQQRAQEVDHE
jgi:hypothetical protein